MGEVECIHMEGTPADQCTICSGADKATTRGYDIPLAGGLVTWYLNPVRQQIGTVSVCWNRQSARNREQLAQLVPRNAGHVHVPNLSRGAMNALIEHHCPYLWLVTVPPSAWRTLWTVDDLAEEHGIGLATWVWR